MLWESATDDTIPFKRPTNPEVGQLFYDTAAEQLNLWDGSAWVAVGGNLANSGGATSTISYQNLTLVGTQLSISNGNTVDLSSIVPAPGPPGPQGPIGPQGNPATDDQTLTASALSINNTLTIAISGGNTEVIDLSNLNQDITGLNFDSKTNSLTVGINNGASQTVDLSNLNQDIAELALDSMTNSLTVGITDGASQTISLDKLQQDIDGLAFNSTTNSLTVGITGGVSQTISLATLGSTTVSGSLTIQSGTSSYTLPTHKGSVGQVLTIDNASCGTTTWTTITAGVTSTAITGLVSVTEGGNIGHRIATREANNHGDIGSNAVDLSYSNDTSSTLHGATGFGSFAAGSETRASGTRSTALGHRTLASGNHTVAIGYTAQASEEYAVALGRGQAQGEDAFAVGPGVFAYSLSEVALGSYPSTYSATSKTAWIPTDRLLVLGNGTGIASRSDALVILKDGTTTLNGALMINASSTTTSYTLPTHKGTAGQVLTIDNATTGTTTWTNLEAEASTGLVSLTEGGNSGHRLTTEDAANHGDIGRGAVDLSIQTTTSSLRGATGEFSFALGSRTTASGDYSTTFGRSTIASASFSTAFGFETQAHGEYSTATGNGALAGGDYSTAFGRSTTASSRYSTAFGRDTSATGEYSTAFGEDTAASGDHSVAMGESTNAESYGQTSLGLYNTPHPGTPNATASVAGDRLLVVGNGTTPSTRSDALVILKDGTTTLNGALTINTTSTTASYTLPVGGGSNGHVLSMLDATTGTTTWTTVAAGGDSTGLVSVTENENSGYRLAQEPAANHGDIGAGAVDLSIQTFASSDTGATGDNSFAAGANTEASGRFGVALGLLTVASNSFAVAIGNRSSAEGLASVAIGDRVTASGHRSVALGGVTTAIGDFSVAIGQSTNASGSHSVALGESNTASGSHSVALGERTIASGDQSFAVGNGSQALGNGSVVWGGLFSNGFVTLPALVASGEHSTAFGLATRAAGRASLSWGTSTQAPGQFATAWGASSIASGQGTLADSFGQTSLGNFNTAHPGIPTVTSLNLTDRLFVIGNGTSAAVRSDALVMLKNGNTTLNGALTLDPTGTSSYTLPTAKGTAGQVLTMLDATAGITHWTTPGSGVVGSFKSLEVEEKALFNNGIEIEGTFTQKTEGTLHADYVFESYFDGVSKYNKNYSLPSLEAVETFVRKNKHLPGVQSRADIMEKGKWDVTENVRTNLEKVEELYLHTIEQGKKIEAQNKLIEQLIARLEALEKKD